MTAVVILLLLINVILLAAIVVIWQNLRRPNVTNSNLDQETIINRLRDSISAISHDTMSKITTDFLHLANETLSKQTKDGAKELEANKRLIDQSLESIKSELINVQRLVTNTEKDSMQKFGELNSQLKLHTDQTIKLHKTTDQLKTALVSTTARGQWGQRMAEDILRLAGFVEGVNYLKEKAQDSVSTRPDFTFLLPHGLKVNMDVKFPFNNYFRYLDTENEAEKQRLKDLFLRDARSRIKEVTGRDYINPDENTVDYVIVFIPNEQVYSFINDSDRAMLDDALKSKVIFCSPLTLYAVLAVMRQAIDNFNLEKTAAHILSLLSAFDKHWETFIKSFDKLGKKIQETQDEYNSLTSTRRNQLDRQLRRIAEIRKQKGIESAESPDNSQVYLENKPFDAEPKL